jgi:VanZ family protein
MLSGRCRRCAGYRRTFDGDSNTSFLLLEVPQWHLAESSASNERRDQTVSRSGIVLVRIALLFTSLAVMHLATTDKDYSLLNSTAGNVNHIIAFYVLALLTDFSFPHRQVLVGKSTALLAYGLSIEVIQSFLPYRDSSMVDLLSDGAGIFLYWIPALSGFVDGRLAFRWCWYLSLLDYATLIETASSLQETLAYGCRRPLHLSRSAQANAERYRSSLDTTSRSAEFLPPR